MVKVSGLPWSHPFGAKGYAKWDSKMAMDSEEDLRPCQGSLGLSPWVKKGRKADAAEGEKGGPMNPLEESDRR